MKLRNKLLLIFLVLLALTPLVGPALNYKYEDELRGKQAYEKKIAELSWLRSHSEVDPWGNPWAGGMCASRSWGPNGIDEGGGGDDISFNGPWEIDWGPAVTVTEAAPFHYLLLVVGKAVTVFLVYNFRSIQTRGKKRVAWIIAALPITAVLLWFSEDLHLSRPLKRQYMDWLFRDIPPGTSVTVPNMWEVSAGLGLTLICCGLLYSNISSALIRKMDCHSHEESLFTKEN
ncbi:MAG: hypothetical protein P1V97_29785 [Planctomycetota bacterium]|nr:hypothetical protein [Planctomycetota bacterium]